MFTAHQAKLAEIAARNRLPAVGVWRSSAQAGFLMSYGPEQSALFRRAASYVDKILRGAKPGDLPIEQPTTYELVITRDAAEGLPRH